MRVKKKLQKRERLDEYDDAIQNHLDNDHMEKAPTFPDGPMHHLAQQAVYKKDEARAVFGDAAGQPSVLNDYQRRSQNFLMGGVWHRRGTR